MDYLSNFHFNSPYWLLALVLLVFFPLISKIRFLNIENRKYLKIFAKKNLQILLKSSSKSHKKPILFYLFFILIILSLAGPRFKYEEVLKLEDKKNILFLLDSSLSMSVNDVAPSRFQMAQDEILKLIDNLYGNRVGVIAFTNVPHVISSFTSDYKEVKKRVSSLSLTDFSAQGSDLNTALKISSKILKNISADNGSDSFIVIFTDGELSQKTSPKILKKIKGNKVFIYAVGTKIGAPVIKDNRILEYGGEKVISKLDFKALEEIANDLEGKVTRLDYSNSNSFLDYFSSFSRTENSSKSKYKKWSENFNIFLIPAIFILLLMARRGELFLLALCFTFFNAGESRANVFLNDDQKAIREFNEKDFDNASKKFSSKHNKGIANYRNKNYQAAIESFKKTNHDKSMFNLGNSYFYQKQYSESVESYKKYLESNPDDKKAQHNLKVAQKYLKKQQSKKKQNQAKKKQNQAKKKQNQEKKDNKKDKNKSKKQKKNQAPKKQQEKNYDKEFFNLLETDSHEILKKKIKAKEKKSRNTNSKPW